MLSKTVLVVEDEALLRNLIAGALTSEGYDVLSAGSAAEANAAAERHVFDVAVLDVDLGTGPTGMDVAQALYEWNPDIALVFLTGLPDPRFAQSQLPVRNGKVAYLRKSALSDLDKLFEAISLTLIGRAGKAQRDDLAINRPLRGLTQNQIDVLSLMSQGHSNAQIARSRGVSVKAIEDTIRRACTSLGINADETGNTRVAAVRAYLHAIGGAAPSGSDKRVKN